MSANKNMCSVVGRIDHDHTTKTNVIQYLTQISQRRKADSIDYLSKVCSFSCCFFKILLSGDSLNPNLFFDSAAIRLTIWRAVYYW